MKLIHLMSILVIAAAGTAAACSDDSPVSAFDEVSGDGGAKTDASVPSGPPPTYAVGGTVTGLSGTGLVLQNGEEELPIASDGSFAFPTKLTKGAPFSVSIKTQPTAPTQTCSVNAGSGTVGSGNVSTIVINCSTDEFTVGGSVTGLAGAGLTLQNNAGDDIIVNGDGEFAFPTTIASGGAYAITVKTQPNTPSQTCVVTEATGSVVDGPISTVKIACTTNHYFVGGTVSGLSGSGLVLQINDGATLPISQNGAFSFVEPLDSGTQFTVKVSGQPSSPTQTCTVNGNTGTVGGADVVSIAVDCDTNTYTIGGTVSGLAGTVVLQNNEGNDLPVTSNGTFAFGVPVASGNGYAVTVKTQPGAPSQTCAISNGVGSVESSDITDVQLSCVTNTFKVKANVVGLAGAGLVLQNNHGDDIPVNADGTFEFAEQVASAEPYEVTVLMQPSGPSQTCTVTDDIGTIGGEDVTATVTCVTDSFTVGGTVSGLAGAGLVLTSNGEELAISEDGTFTFGTPVLSGLEYLVGVKTQPTGPTQTCKLAAESGTVTNGNVVTVGVNCSTNAYSVGGTASGLAGTGLVLTNNDGDDLTVNGNGEFAFGTPVSSGGGYLVAVKTQPTNPSQTCVLTAESGPVVSDPITTIGIVCTTNSFHVGGTLTGLAESPVVLSNNNGDDITLDANGTFTFPAALLSGTPYAVTVKTKPADRYCKVTNGKGTVGNGDVTSPVVTCFIAYPVSTVCGKTNPSGILCSGNCTNNHDQYADYYCQLAGYTEAVAFDVVISGVVQCPYYNASQNGGVLSQCSQLVGPASYGLASYCDAVTNLMCH